MDISSTNQRKAIFRNHAIRIKASIEANNFSGEEGPSGEEVIIWAYGRTACDKHDKVCECCKRSGVRTE